MRLTALRVHPVKSLAGYDVRQAELLPWGLADDRRWGVCADDGEEVTAREVPALLHVTATPHGDGGLTLAAPRHGTVTVAAPAEGTAYDSDWTGHRVGADPAASAWLSGVVGGEVVLVHQSTPRAVKAKHGGLPGDTVSLADTAPLLLTSQSSLARLDAWVEETAEERGQPSVAPLSMVRFRPNLVVDGEEPFAEDRWRRVRVGEVVLRFAECCDRCVMPTYDPVTLAKSHEPTRTLARHRRWDGAVWFGIRLVPETLGVLHVGDHVEVLDRVD